jgi:polysaccharide biosynthesis transport protein
MLARREPIPVVVKPGIETDLEPWSGDVESYSARGDSWDLRSLLSTLYRRRWWVIGVAACAIAAAVVYLLTATPVYEARVKLLIDSQSPNVVSFKGVIEDNTEKLDYYETQLGILRSRTLARKTLDRLNLWNHPDLSEKKAGRLSRLLSPVLSKLKPGWSDATRRDETAAQSRTIDAFLKRLTISYRADNRLVDVGFESTDRHLAADVANALAHAYIEQNLDIKLHASKEASDWLNARLAEQRTQVRASEMTLQQYREQNADVSLSEQQNVITQRLAELSTAATRAKTERIDTEALYQQLEALRNNPSGTNALPLMLNNPLIQNLKTELGSLQREEATLSEQLGDRHPDLIRVKASIRRVEGQLQAEVSKVADSVRTQIVAMREKERNLGAALETQERAALGLNRRGIQYGALQREVTSNRQIFDTLLERAKQTEISADLKIGNTQVVDPAELPQTPASPQPQLVLMLAFLLGLPLGVGTALGVDYLDDRVQSPDEIKMGLGLKFLGFAPAIPRAEAKARRALVNDGASSEFAEALRTVRANLLITAPGADNVLLLTSTGPGEGKTVIAANMAVALAQAGRRVLLIDADMRRCQMHDIFEAPLTPGLSAVLDGSVRMIEAITPTDIDGLSILTAGSTPQNPGDLLDGETFGEAIASVRNRFDWIVVDSPPVMVASDTTSLARVATAVLFVVGAAMTTPRHARAALEQLEGARAKIVGAVLSRGRAYRYSPYAAYTARSYNRYGDRH